MLEQRKNSVTAKLRGAAFTALVEGWGKWVYIKGSLTIDGDASHVETAGDLDVEALVATNPEVRLLSPETLDGLHEAGKMESGDPRRLPSQRLRLRVSRSLPSLWLIAPDEVTADDWTARKFRTYKYSMAWHFLSVGNVNLGCVQVRTRETDSASDSAGDWTDCVGNDSWRTGYVRRWIRNSGYPRDTARVWSVMDRQMDRQMDSQTDNQTDRQTDGMINQKNPLAVHCPAPPPLPSRPISVGSCLVRCFLVPRVARDETHIFEYE